MSPRRRLPLVLCLALAACGGVADRYGSPESGYVEDPAAATGAVDWSEAVAVTVELSSFEFTPDDLVFRTGTPYALTLVNESSSAHTFTAPGFFRAIAVRALTGAEDATAAARLESIGLQPGEAKRLDFVPVKPGTYALECDRPLHDVFGMTGELRIE